MSETRTAETVEEAAREEATAASARLRSLLARERRVREVCEALARHSGDLSEALTELARSLREFTGCEAIAVRLREGCDYPYFVQDGFSDAFVRSESSLLQRKCTKPGCKGMCGSSHDDFVLGTHKCTASGGTCSHKEQCTDVDKCKQDGKLTKEKKCDHVSLDCMCGNVIRGLYDSDLSVFTNRGTFWTNDLQAAEVDKFHFGCPQRGMCALTGYRSMALTPIRIRGEGVGLIQCNDKKPNVFTPDSIDALETIASTVGVALVSALRQSKLKGALAESLSHLSGPASSYSNDSHPIPAPPSPQPHSREGIPGAKSSDIEDMLGRLNMDHYVDVFRRKRIELPEQLTNVTSAEELASSLGISAISANKVITDIENRGIGLAIISDVELGAKIGQGEFGTVWNATWGGSGSRVAVKQVRSVVHTKELLREAAVLARLSHPHVLRFFGITNVGGLPALVTELASGSLLTLLQSGHVRKGSRELLEFAEAAAAGLEYLAARGIVHRDLACRNILYTLEGTSLSDSLYRPVLKIADFGLARRAADTSVHGWSKVPVRWSALETLTLGVCTLASDVWSFGVVLWEIYSLGATPFASMANGDVVEHVARGNRLPPPAGCPPELVSLMYSLWIEEPQLRPRMADVHAKISVLLEQQPITGVPPVTLDAITAASSRGNGTLKDPLFAAKEQRRRKCEIL